MFEKKTYIYSENMGVCYVEDVTKLITARKKEVMYYVLRPVYRQGKTAYIPVENHSVGLRELCDPDKAKEELLADPQLHQLAVELGFIPSDEETEDDPQKKLSVDDNARLDAMQLKEEKEEEKKRLDMQYKMADTLPFEQRSALYKRGEIEFVLRRSIRQQAEKKRKKSGGKSNEVS